MHFMLNNTESHPILSKFEGKENTALKPSLSVGTKIFSRVSEDANISKCNQLFLYMPPFNLISCFHSIVLFLSIVCIRSKKKQ